MRSILVHHVHAVADAFGVADSYRIADVKPEAIRGNETRRQLARVQRDVRRRIVRVQEIEHLHLQREIPHGVGAVFRLHEIQRHDLRCGRARKSEAGDHLREHRAELRLARHLRHVADRHRTPTIGLRRAALQR